MPRNTVTNNDGSDSEPEQDSPDINPASQIFETAEEVIQPIKLVRSAVNFRLHDRETKPDKSKKSVEVSTQTEHLKSDSDTIPRMGSAQEGCLSILRIFPMKTNMTLDRSKVVMSVCQQKRGSAEDSLKTVRKWNKDLERLRDQA